MNNVKDDGDLHKDDNKIKSISFIFIIFAT